ncbi:MAG: hypothetical protein U0521_06390 [Anaerolineae bacterium]
MRISIASKPLTAEVMETLYNRSAAGSAAASTRAARHTNSSG